MADFQSEFDETTNTLDSIVTTQLSAVSTWNNIAGGLTKASSSASYVWGFNSNNEVFRCQLPCSGNWVKVDLPGISTILDLTTDENNVYVLATAPGASILVTSPSIDVQWTFINIPGFGPSQIFSTHTFIWAQDSSNKKEKCAKPCTTGLWTAVDDTSVTITSSSASALYGKDASGVAMKSDETLQTGWSPIAGLAGTKVKAILGQMDSTALYQVDTSSNVLRWDYSNPPEPVDTAGYQPISLSPDPISKDLWMTTSTSGTVGNVFNKLDKPDYSSIMNKIQPLNTTRDKIVTDVQNEYSLQTNVMSVNKLLSDFIDYFKRMFNVGNDTAKKANDDIGHLEDEIRNTQMQLDQIKQTQPFIQILLVTVLTVALLYMFGSIVGTLIHWIAIAILIGGLLFATNFSQASK
jgi:hypothetical protein